MQFDIRRRYGSTVSPRTAFVICHVVFVSFDRSRSNQMTMIYYTRQLTGFSELIACLFISGLGKNKLRIIVNTDTMLIYKIK